MQEINLNDLIKALRCLASHSQEGDCYEDQYNFGNDGQRISCYGSPETLKCPYHQNTYDVCFEDGDCSGWLEDTAELLEELQRYREIGTTGECLGYKIHSQRISSLHNCNDCERKNNCEIMPQYGDDCRVNCYLWEGEAAAGGKQ